MKPEIFDHMDVGAFLQSIYQCRKSQSSTFSYATWANEIGFSNKTILRLILQGKRRMTEKSIQLLKNNLSFTANESEYFDILVEYSQAKSVQQRRAMGQRLIELQRKRFVAPTVSSESGILADVYGPIVLMAISSFSKAASLDEINKHIAIPAEHLERIISFLINANLVEKENGRYYAKQATFKITDQFGNDNLKRFYQYWIEKSAAAIDLPVSLRRFRSLQVALSSDEFESVVLKINEFATNILSQYETNTLEDRNLYLINSALFPTADF